MGDKLALMMEAAFGEWLAPESISIRGIDSIAGETQGYKLIARAQNAEWNHRLSSAGSAAAGEFFARSQGY